MDVHVKPIEALTSFLDLPSIWKIRLDFLVTYESDVLYIRCLDLSIISKITKGGALKQTVADRYVRFAHRRLRLTGNQIYLTDERWTHIVNTHPEMDSHRDNLLLTLQTGRRKQEPLDPSKYKYYKRFDILETGYNHIIVVVKFSEKVEKDTIASLIIYFTGAALALLKDPSYGLVTNLVEEWS